MKSTKSGSFKDTIGTLKIHILLGRLRIVSKGDILVGLVYHHLRQSTTIEHTWGLRNLLGTWKLHVLLLGVHPVYRAPEIPAQNIARILCLSIHTPVAPWQGGPHTAQHVLQPEETQQPDPRLASVFRIRGFHSASNHSTSTPTKSGTTTTKDNFKLVTTGSTDIVKWGEKII